MKIGITSISSKGQIVLPKEFRKNMDVGDKIIFIEQDNHIMIKSAKELHKNFAEDLQFAKRTEKAWKEYEAGKFETTSSDEFLRELEKC
ncbi:MAG: AbrB/MazE/SpoVT family DNA-binding domain-containing protein [Candidatus Woesearchaeota archaeon]